MNARQQNIARLTGGPIVVGRYALFDVIGGGGMAQVHLGRVLGAAGFSRVVAIKRLHPGSAMDPSFTAMLTDEARLASRIRHPNVVPMLDVVANGKEMLLVMEYAPGISLGQLVHLAGERGTPVPQAIVVRIILDVLAGLEAAHDATNERGQPLDLVHRDISPQNVIAGADGHARIVDFGIAKAQDRTGMTGDGQVKGKLGYMPPEQLCGEPVDRRADVYAVGVVFWELLTQRRLFEPRSDELMALLREALDTIAAPPSAYVDVPLALEEVVLKACERDAPNRYATAVEMANALEALDLAASYKEVAAYVRRLAGHFLDERAELVARIEQTAVEDPEDPGPSPVPVYTPPPRADAMDFVSDPFAPRPPSTPALPVEEERRSSKGLLLAVLIGIGLAAIVLIAVFFFRPSPPPPLAELDAGAPVALPTATAVPDPPATTAEPAPPVVPSTTASAPRGRPRKVPSATPSAKPPNCDPPYLIDSRGIRVPRRECL